MSELILKFNLPEEQEEANIVLSASGMHNTIWNFRQELRNKIKYGNHTEEEDKILEEIKDLLNNELENNNVLNLFV